MVTNKQSVTEKFVTKKKKKRYEEVEREKNFIFYSFIRRNYFTLKRKKMLTSLMHPSHSETHQQNCTL